MIIEKLKYNIEYIKVFLHCLKNAFIFHKYKKEKNFHQIVVEKCLDDKDKILYKKVNCLCEFINHEHGKT